MSTRPDLRKVKKFKLKLLSGALYIAGMIGILAGCSSIPEPDETGVGDHVTSWLGSFQCTQLITSQVELPTD